MLCKRILLLPSLFLCIIGLSTHAPSAHAEPGSYPVLAELAKTNGHWLFGSGDHSNLNEHDENGTSLATFGSGLSGPSMMAYSPAGELYVIQATGATSSIAVLNSDGATVRIVEDLAFNSHIEVGLAFDLDGNYYVSTAGKILVFDKNDNFVRAINHPWLTGLSGLAFGPEGYLYCGDYHGSAIHAIDLDTDAVVRTIVGGGLDRPYGLAFRPTGELYVSGFWSHRVHKYDVDGTFLYTLPGGTQRHPHCGIAFDSRGHLFVNFWQGGTWRDGHVEEWDENDNYVRRVRDLFGGRGAVVEAQFTPPVRDNAIVTHSGSDRPRVGVSILTEGDRHWKFGVILGNGRFVPAHQIRTRPRDGSVHRLAFRSRKTHEIVPIDDARVSVKGSIEQPDGTFRSLTLTFDADEDDEPDVVAILLVKNLSDSIELVHLEDAP